MINILNKALFTVLAVSILCSLIIANDYENQKAANKAELARAIAEAREAEHRASTSRNVQKAILDQEIKSLMPTLPKAALVEIKARAR